MTSPHTPTRPLMSPQTLGQSWASLPASVSDWREGDQIGPFQLKRPLGEGGMGTVWLAEQLQPLHRDVAIKVMRQERRGALDEAYFEVERQALARLSHRVIAQIYDAGRLPDGTLFFAMEYVPGVPLDEFIRESRPSPSELARLFADICLGVQHAHQRGLIHRDLKPANLLVQRVDGVAMPKIIDFGIATSVTPAGAGSENTVAGTRAYMSPEQRMPDAAGIDARTDVYALGAVLAESLYLLAGIDTTVEIESTRMRQALTQSLGRDMPADEAALVEGLGELKDVPAELRAIAVHAMAEDRELRYVSVAAMGEDLSRWLARQPVSAMGASRWYSFRCLLRRNALLSFAVVIAVLALGVFAIAMAIQASRIAREADRANAALSELQAVTDFQTGVLLTINGESVGNRIRDELKARHRAGLEAEKLPPAAIDAQVDEMQSKLAAVNFTDIARASLDEGIFARGLAGMREKFAEKPRILAELLQSSAMAMRDLGLLQQSEAPQAEALAIRRRIFGKYHERTAVSLNEAGVLAQYQGKSVEARALFEEAIDVHSKVSGEADLAKLTAMSNLASQLQIAREYKASEALYRQVIALEAMALAADDPQLITTHNNLAVVMYQMGDYAGAEAAFLRLLDLQRKARTDDAKTLTTLNNLSATTRLQGKVIEAEAYLREAITTGSRLQGAEHRQILGFISSMGSVLNELERFDEAEAHYRRALEGRSRVLGENHADTVRSEANLAAFLIRQDRLDEAESLLRHGYAQMRISLGDESAETIFAMADVAELKRKQGLPEVAVAMLREHEAAIRRVGIGASESRLAANRLTLGKALTALGGAVNLAEAQAALEEAHAITLRTRGESHTQTRDLAGLLADLLTTRETLQPGTGHAAKAAEWAAKRNGGQSADSAR